MFYTSIIIAILAAWTVLRILGNERLRQKRILQIQIQIEEAAAKEEARRLGQSAEEKVVELKAA